jgi:hypothetical protein
MGMTMRVSLPGYDALTDGTIDHYSLYADTDNILIKEKARGTVGLDWDRDGTITHSLGYTPFYLVYSPITTSGRYRISNSFDPIGGGWRAYVDTASLYIYNGYGTSAGSISKYYIFYDNVGGTL